MADEKSKAIERSKEYFHLYEKVLSQANAAISFIRSNDEQPKSNKENADKIREILLQQRISAPNPLSLKKQEISKVITEEISSIAFKKESPKGIHEFALPKIKILPFLFSG
jgi:hypothetical protein